VSEQAGVWLRVSSGAQDEEHQRPDCKTWCESRKYNVAAEYIVHGKSAFKGNPKFEETWARVIDDMQTGRISVLVVWKQDRIDRKLNTFQMMAEVVRAGGRVEFVTQPHLNDLTTMGGRIALKVQEEIAHAESRDKSDRVVSVHRTIRANGGNPGRAPWGYVSAGDKYAKRLEPTEEGRRLVPLIFERIVSGQSLQTVATWLESETGREWWAFRVALLIRNPTYRGYRVNAKGVTVHRCEPLVDAALWTRANRTLAGKTGKRGTAKGESALLTSVIFCGPCYERGAVSPMYRHPAYPGYTYYRCVGTGTSRKGCGNLIRLELADSRVVEWLSMMGAPHQAHILIEGESYETELAEVQLELAELPKRGLSDEDEDTERLRLRELRDELEEKQRNARPDQKRRVNMGVTVGEHFRALDAAGQRAYLLDERIRVYAWRPVGKREFSPIEIRFPDAVP